MSKGLFTTAKYFKRDNALVTAGTFTVATFVKLQTLDVTHSIFGFYDADSDDNWFRLAVNSDNKASAQMKSAGVLEEVLSLATLSAGIWHFVGARINAAGMLSVWLDKNRRETVPDKPWAINLDNSAIGVRLTNTITEPLQGYIGPIVAWESTTPPTISWMRDKRRDPRYYGPNPCDHYWKMLRGQIEPNIPNEVKLGPELENIGAVPCAEDGPEPELSVVARAWRVGSWPNYIGGDRCARYRRFFTGQRDRSASPLRRRA